MCVRAHALEGETLKGSLSVLKLMPGTYLSQTGNPLHITREIIEESNTTPQDQNLELETNNTKGCEIF